MRKALIVGGVAAGVATGAALAKRRAWSSGGFDVEQWIERMPENAPPRWVLNNISAIRENTERILRLLESEQGSAERLQ